MHWNDHTKVMLQVLRQLCFKTSVYLKKKGFDEFDSQIWDKKISNINLYVLLNKEACTRKKVREVEKKTEQFLKICL